MRFHLLILLVLGCSFSCGAQLIRYQDHYKVGYKSSSGKVIVRAVYDAGSDMSDGFAVVMRGALRGYIDARGKEVIACQYGEASPFVHGLACVQQNGSWGFINTSGAWAIQPQFDNAFSYKSGLARVLTGGKWGMIDEQGHMVIPPIYARLYDISEGLIAASKDEQGYGYLDAVGKVAIDFKFGLSLPFDESTHKAIVHQENGAYFINTKGEVLERVPERKEEGEFEREGRRD
jgi:hypothetical protein